MPKLTTPTAITVLAAALAGCGGGTTAAPRTTTTSSPGAPKDPATSFSLKSVHDLGRVLVDGRGRTVYVLTSAAKKNVPCTDDSGCTDVWPDLSLPDGTSSATAGVGVDDSLLGTMEANGETYPTYNGYLLYEYANDDRPGDDNGEGIKSFGGTWYTLNASGTPVKHESMDNYGGYGY
ncbi:MAG: hypothetical protein QOG85_770 [Gaiellaceae bacterium]|jgi:predicted lipoprotein with Yx(FWY)xxD motif|nr:hypothetical protein [Gaiellaceae bacterium]